MQLVNIHILLQPKGSQDNATESLAHEAMFVFLFKMEI